MPATRGSIVSVVGRADLRDGAGWLGRRTGQEGGQRGGTRCVECWRYQL